MIVNFLIRFLWYRACDICFDNKCMFWGNFIACYCWMCCFYVLLKYCCVDSIPFFVCWAGITKVSFDINKISQQKLKLMWWRVFVYFSSFEIYALRTYLLCLMAAEDHYIQWLCYEILLWSSVVKSPFHIRFNICPYSGSS